MKLHIPLAADCYLSLFSISAQTLMAKEATMSFYAALGHTIISILKEEKLIVLEDVNARVGKQHGTWEALDLYGIEK